MEIPPKRRERTPHDRAGATPTMKLHLAALALLWTGSAVSFAANPPAPAKPINFDRDIRPILSENCFACHGPDANKRKAKLRLDTKAGAFADLGGSFALVPGKPEESTLIDRISSDDPDEIMPPPKSEKRLTPAQIELLRRWVASGAEYKGHWAFERPSKPGLPPAPATNEIDRFVRARLAEKGLTPSPRADRSTLIRRLSFDLIGLPPTPAEVKAFVEDQSPNAYEKVVDRLLASPHYGERMAMAWLDWVRYADTAGYHSDNERQVFLYRDYVIGAFNANKPFDRFTIEQIAGDLLPNPTREQKIASGYNRILMTTEEGGAQAKEYTAKYAADRVRNASNVWMAATLGCAECHDHKFDPYTAKDFYRFAAFFSDIQEVAVGSQPPTKLPTPEQQSRLNELDARIASTQRVLDTPTPALAAAQADWEKSASVKRDRWTTLIPASAISKAGTPLKIEADGTVMAQGTPAENDIYTVTFESDRKALSALRLDVLPDPAFPNRGPGRAGNGNFVLHEFTATAEGKPIPLARPSAEYSQPGWDIAGAIDGNPSTGWAMMERAGKPNHAVFETRSDLGDGKPLSLVVSLAMNYGGAHVIGKFRVAATDAPRPVKAGDADGLPVAVRDALAIATDKRSKPQADAIAAHYRSIAPLLASARKTIADLRAERESVMAVTPTMLVASSGPPRTMRILPRGNWLDETGPEVTPAVPAFLAPEIKGRRASRLDLASWLVSADNPLVARVFVNRLWKIAFGQGIVASLEDFGAQGNLPTHPELLDWLAVSFREDGWDVKRMLKRIVMSETYQQSSHATESLREADPNNQWLARQGRYRLDAEFVRDDMLVVSGLLAPRIGGPSVKPYQPAGYWEHLNFPRRTYQNDHGDGLYRRGMYTFWQRTFLHPSLLAFDAPSREECTAQRPRSNTPLQALVLLNDPIYVEGARAFAERIVSDGGKDVDSRLAFAFQRAVSRDPRVPERDVLKALLAKHRAYFGSHAKEADEFLHVGERPVPKQIDTAELAAWTSVARTILNLHETITRN
jgi:mono/diheme cytochrome c family protein